VLSLSLLATPLAWSQAAPSPTSQGGAELAPWNLGASVSGYSFENQSDYVQPTVTIDHSVLHLEARYQYEALHTGSLWMGWNFSWGKQLQLALTPMFGGVFGAQAGIAIAVEWTLSWGPLSWFSEPELVLDFKDSSQNNINVWSQLTVQPLAWLQLGLAIQRNRAHAEKVDVAWGPALGFTVWKLTLTGYWFNPGNSSTQYWSVALALTAFEL
jgi:hypothetical protein